MTRGTTNQKKVSPAEVVLERAAPSPELFPRAVSASGECARTILFPRLCLPGHLTYLHLAEFLRRCKQGLCPNGIIVIKDNMAQEGVILDDVDSSVCRDLEVVHGIFRSAGLSLLAQEQQENLPDEIYHVYSLALR
ncbi:PREDICTED: N-terminal Xaa-Pro-Lys N-methyltransferase 1-like [Myotis brandtii]|uniref:N-terminal Xaa-Pro-Lys N-methyltransferase 1-like n=1 Tax=Myotis brandtii TaxID=109478 RepID=UPI000703F420|nr:PREDICTED: N-terminal Xaa-Pro-Lys N-methyltransferase 1-like [Myotis brandtii]